MLSRKLVSFIRLPHHYFPMGSFKIRKASTSSQTQSTAHAIPGVDNLILVSSAKGGKSTVAVNLALALHKNLQKPVGLLDADVFGPSIPKMLNLEGVKPDLKDNLIIPLQNYGIKCMSLGFLVSPDKAVVWRGLMVMSAIKQLLRQVAWGPLHTLVVDMPPGTGDVQLSICQNVPVQGTIIVTTPQAVATSDTNRGISMLRKLNIPICGVVENMSEYLCPACGHRESLFADHSHPGSDASTLSGGQNLALTNQLPLLAQIPIDPKLVRAGDQGQPLVVQFPDSETAKIYDQIAIQLIQHMTQYNRDTS